MRLKFWQSNQCPHFPTHWMQRLFNYERAHPQKISSLKRSMIIEKLKKILVVSITNLWSINLQEALFNFFQLLGKFDKKLEIISLYTSNFCQCRVKITLLTWELLVRNTLHGQSYHQFPPLSSNLWGIMTKKVKMKVLLTLVLLLFHYSTPKLIELESQEAPP